MNKRVLDMFSVIIMMAYIQMLIQNIGGNKRSMGECWWTAKDKRGLLGIMDNFSESLRFMVGDDS